MDLTMRETCNPRQFLHRVTLADYREKVCGPLQFQLLIVATFLLPLGVKLAYTLGFSRPSLWWQRLFVLAIAFATLLVSYRIICRLLGIPTTKQTKTKRR